jgi:RNA-splicing ligase RtcB
VPYRLVPHTADIEIFLEEAPYLDARPAAQAVVLRAATRATVDEEMPKAYKAVARVVHGERIGRKVAQLKPIGVVKG